MAEKYADDGLVVLWVNGTNDPKDVVAKFVEEKRLKQHVLLDGKDVVLRTYRLGWPVVLLIDRSGVIVDMTLGTDDPRPFSMVIKKFMRENHASG